MDKALQRGGEAELLALGRRFRESFLKVSSAQPPPPSPPPPIEICIEQPLTRLNVKLVHHPL